MTWKGPSFQSKARVLEAAVITGEVEFVRDSIYEERCILAEALENWIENFKGVMCENLNCPCLFSGETI